MADEFTGRIRITKMPAGEADPEMRQAWVDNVLCCLPVMGFSADDEIGIISGETTKKRYGFFVPQDTSLAVLELGNPAAAEYFRNLGYPRPNQCFFFDESEAEIISGVERQKMRVHNDLDDHGSSDWLFRK